MHGGSSGGSNGGPSGGVRIGLSQKDIHDNFLNFNMHMASNVGTKHPDGCFVHVIGAVMHVIEI